MVESHEWLTLGFTCVQPNLRDWASVGGNYLRRKPELIVEEIKTIKERNIYFADDETLLDAKRMFHLADLIRDDSACYTSNVFLYCPVGTKYR